MNRRLTWLSLGLNLLLLVALAVLWLKRHPASPPPPLAHSRAARPGPTVTAQPAASETHAAAASPPAFHWAEIESDDYRQYIANLRALGCPERLIRDLIVADLDQLYEARRGAVKRERLPPWAGHDRRASTHLDYKLRRQALQDEQLAVTEELLGFPWTREAIVTFHGEEIAWLLLGHVAPEQALQALSLPEIARERAELVRERADGILLTEDKAELAALAEGLEAQLGAVLTPQLFEELRLRLQALLVLGDGDLHLEAAEVTGAQAREVARLSRRLKDPLREELFRGLEISEEERERREAEFKAAVSKALGPAVAADLELAKDERFREALDFTRERQLPRQAAVTAFEIRAAAEEAAGQLAADEQLDAAARQAQLEELQVTTAAALTRALGNAHVPAFLEKSGEWLNEIGRSEPATPEDGE